MNLISRLPCQVSCSQYCHFALAIAMDGMSNG